MKIVRYTTGGGARVGVLDENGAICDAGTSIFDANRAGAEVGKAKLLAPVDKPGKILCIGLNYKKHAEESNSPAPPNPVLFAKSAEHDRRAGREHLHPADHREGRLRSRARRRHRTRASRGVRS